VLSSNPQNKASITSLPFEENGLPVVRIILPFRALVEIKILFIKIICNLLWTCGPCLQATGNDVNAKSVCSIKQQASKVQSGKHKLLIQRSFTITSISKAG
jgi:hypothetical protein